MLAGNWEKFRQLQGEKFPKKGWWGSLLTDKSSHELTREVEAHLESKMVDHNDPHWDERLQRRIDEVPLRDEFVPFTMSDVRAELHEM